MTQGDQEEDEQYANLNSFSSFLTLEVVKGQRSKKCVDMSEVKSIVCTELSWCDNM